MRIELPTKFYKTSTNGKSCFNNIPFFNRTESLKRAINSVLNQTYKNIEIILINDGSNESITDIESIAKNKIYIYIPIVKIMGHLTQEIKD